MDNHEPQMWALINRAIFVAGESANLWRELQEEEEMEQGQAEAAEAEGEPGVFKNFLNGVGRCERGHRGHM